ncbi:MAG TPA: FAD-binding oxidoreductase [Candidatus Dormibacteraeota bacterium]|nr:FAD-binding oxidoreductase [Candidatus Dormibacteraeota bacterium]
MSSKVAHYLQEHLVGEVMTSTDARRYFATDGSILQLAPALIAYPRTENDVRKTARFSWQLAERGRVIPITARGSGTNQTGAALGNGIMLVFPAHMNRVLELDTKDNSVTVEPGINYGKLQQTLYTHGRFLPPYPPSLEYSTIGGAIADNVSGEKSVKYGDMRAYVKSLRVVLANGEVIETKRLSKRELSKKLGLATFEGEIYRSVDTLLEEQHSLVEELPRNVTRNSAGYDLAGVKRKDGSFDLTQLMAGSQGTLGIITEAVLKTESYDPQTTLIMARFDSLEQVQNAIVELRSLPERPSAIEMVDEYVLEQVHALNPNQLKEIIKPPFPAITLFVEFDGGERKTKKVSKRAERILDKYSIGFQATSDPEQQQLLWKVRQATSSILGHNEGLLQAVPLFDAAVPPDRLREYLDGVYHLLKTNNLKPAIWGHAGDASLHFQPLLNLGQVGDRQKAFRLMEEHNKLAISLGGTISATAGDGRLRTPYLEAMYGPEPYALMQKVKKIFDPYGTLNPGVKFGTSLDDIKAMIRSDYSIDHLYDHLPRS